MQFSKSAINNINSTRFARYNQPEDVNCILNYMKTSHQLIGDIRSLVETYLVHFFNLY